MPSHRKTRRKKKQGKRDNSGDPRPPGATKLPKIREGYMREAKGSPERPKEGYDRRKYEKHYRKLTDRGWEAFSQALDLIKEKILDDPNP